MNNIELTCCVLCVCLCAVASWFYLSRSNKSIKKATQKLHYSLPNDLRSRSQTQWLAGDRSELELSFEINGLDSIRISGKKTFFLKKVPNNDFEAGFFLNDYLGSRPDKLTLNGAMVARQAFQDYRLELDREKLHIGKNELYFSYIFSDNQIRNSTLVASREYGIAYLSQGMQSIGGIMPSIEHPSIELEVSSSFRYPQNAYFVSTSLGEAFSKTENRSDTVISNKKILKQRNLGLAIIEKSKYLRVVESYETLSVEWFVPKTVEKMILELLDNCKDQLKTLVSRHKVHFSLEMNTKVAVAFNDCDQNSITEKLAILSIKNFQCQTAPVTLCLSISELLIRSVDRKQVIRSIKDYIWHEQFFTSYSLAIVHEASRHCDDTLSSTSYIIHSASTAGCLKHGCLTQSQATMNKRDCLKPLLREMACSIDMFADHKDCSIDIYVTKDGHAICKTDHPDVIDRTVLYAASSKGVRSIKLNRKAIDLTNKLSYFDSLVRDKELILSTSHQVTVNQDIERLAYIDIDDKTLEIAVKMIVSRQGYTIKQINGNQYIDMLVELVSLCDSNLRYGMIRALILEATKVIGHLKLASRSLKLNELSAALKKIEVCFQNNKVAFQNLQTSLLDCETKVAKFADTLVEYFRNHSLEGTLDRLIDFYPLVAEQNDMSNQFNLLLKSELDEGIVLLFKEAFKGRRADFRQSLALTDSQVGLLKKTIEPQVEEFILNPVMFNLKLAAEGGSLDNKSMSWGQLNDPANPGGVQQADLAVKSTEMAALDKNHARNCSQDNSESDKIEHILNKLSELCDSNIDQLESEYGSSDIHRSLNGSRHYVTSSPSKHYSARSMLASQSLLHNISAISQNTKDSNAGGYSLHHFEMHAMPRSRHFDINRSIKNDGKTSDSKTKKKNHRHDKAGQRQNDTDFGAESASRMRDKVKYKSKRGLPGKFTQIVEDDLEYTPKSRATNVALNRNINITRVDVAAMMRQWQLEYDAEVDHIIDNDIKGIKLKYLESNESQDVKDNLLEHVKQNCYRRGVSMYMLMRARKKSDIGSIYGLLQDCGIINQVSFPSAKLRSLVDQVVASRCLNCRFKRSSFVDLLILVAVERFYQLGEADTLTEVCLRVTVERRYTIGYPRELLTKHASLSTDIIDKLR